MLGPVASVTCHDAHRPDLAGRLSAAADRAGVTAWVSDAAGTEGEVAVLEVAVGDLGLGSVDRGEGWRALSSQLAAVVDEVRPAIALGGFSPVLDLDEPGWRVDRLQWCSGRVEVAHLDADQVTAFNELAGQGLVEVRDGAVRWAVPPGVPLGVELLDVAPLALAAAAYEAWTGEAADLEPVPTDVDDVNLPALWLWRPEALARLADEVRAALPDHDVSVEESYGRFAPVVAVPPAPLTDQADLLDELRRLVTATGPAWGGLLPRGGFVPPGLTPEMPEAGLVDHLWLRTAWAGDALGAVREALPGVEGEVVGEGVLFTTGPDPRGDRAVEMLWPPMVRYRRLCEVARILGQRVRDDVVGPDVVI